MWEVLIEESATVRCEENPSRFFLVGASWRGGDLFRVEEMEYIYVTERAKAWLEQEAAEHVSFQEVTVL